ncbi:MAG: hypothetical protein DRH04_04665 [Deltaproteobacteria bacterium]|nr:MAG: hypothetical protein DRH04_04665 [Deltaproteobacteria bacterium]
MTEFEWPADPEDNRQYCRLEQLNPGWWQQAAELISRKELVFPHMRIAADGIELPWWGKMVRVVPASRQIIPLEESRQLSYQEGLVILGLLKYASEHQSLPPAQGLVTAGHLKGGATFFRGPHVMASVLIARHYARDGRAFLDRGLALGGMPSSYGEFGVEFSWFPGLSWIVALWEEDDEFEARAEYLFDRNIETLFALDVVWALGNVVARKIMGST